MAIVLVTCGVSVEATLYGIQIQASPNTSTVTWKTGYNVASIPAVAGPVSFQIDTVTELGVRSGTYKAVPSTPYTDLLLSWMKVTRADGASFPLAVTLLISPISYLASLPGDQHIPKQLCLVSGEFKLTASAPPERVDSVSEEDEFVEVEREPEFDFDALGRRVVYPDIARRMGNEGEVLVGAYVGTDGYVQRLEIVESSAPMMNYSAFYAVGLTKFTPAIANGKPTALWVRIPIIFKLK